MSSPWCSQSRIEVYGGFDLLPFEPLEIPLQVLQLICSPVMSGSSLISQASRTDGELNS